MASHTLTQKPKNTVEITLTVPWTTIQEEYTKSFEELAKEVEAEGFRKGKVPKEVAKKHVPQEKIYDHMLRHYLPAAYEAVLQEEKIKPAAQPKISLKKAKEQEDWEILFTVALVPEINVENYQDIVKKARESAETPKIWTPGSGDAQTTSDTASSDQNASKDPKKASEASSGATSDDKPLTEEQQREKQLQTALDALVKEIDVEISDVLLEEEVENRISKLNEDLKRLGMTMDAYLSSRQTTEEQLKEQITKEIEETYRLEFILQAIADKEDMQVGKEDIDRMMEQLKTEEEKKAFVQNIYYYASLLRKQKVLEHMMKVE